MKANGVVSGVSAITNFAGPVLGGLLYGIRGIEPIILITCISFFLCAVTEMFIRIPYEKGKQAYGAVKTILYDLKDGAEYILKKNILLFRIIIVAAVMNVFITPLFLVGIPYIIKIEMGMEDQFFGFTQGGISLSMIIAAVAIGAVASKLKISNLYVWFIVSGLVIIPMAFSVHPLFMEQGSGGMIQYVIFSICTMLVMFVITIINIFIMTMLQQQTPSLLLGKVLAILTAVSTCAVPVGQILFGSLLESFAGIVYNLLFIVAFVTIVIAVATRWMLRTKNDEYSVEVDNAVL